MEILYNDCVQLTGLLILVVYVIWRNIAISTDNNRWVQDSIKQRIMICKLVKIKKEDNYEK